MWQHLVREGSKLVCEPVVSSVEPVVSSVDDNKLDEMEKSEEIEEQLLDRMGTNNMAFVDVVTALAKRTMATCRGKTAYLAYILESSMMVNICLFCTSDVAVETIVFLVWIFNFDEEAAILQIILSAFLRWSFWGV
jgi:hypothetical protein